MSLMHEQVHQRASEDQQIGQRAERGARCSRSTQKAPTSAKPIAATPVRVRHQDGAASVLTGCVRAMSRHPHPHPHPHAAEVFGQQLAAVRRCSSDNAA
jgi:hypothetical protein